MKNIYAVTNQKGGVAKTTTAVNLAAAFGRAGFKTLLIDVDPQGNASVSSGVDIHNLGAGVYEVLLGEVSIKDAIVKASGDYNVLPASADLAGAQVELVGRKNKEYLLYHALGEVIDEYQIVLIDTPPSLNILTVSALCAASSVLIPVQCEYFALEGITALMSTLKKVQAGLNPNLQIAGVVRTLYDPRTSLTLEVSKQLQNHFGAQLFTTTIPRNVRLAEAPSHGESGIDYDLSCAGSRAYLALAKELLDK